MNLENISQNVCECGAVVVGETKGNKHSNGGYNESRQFECGATLRWSPNFRDFHNCTECPNSKKQLSLRNKRKGAKDEVVSFISKLDVDKQYIDRLLGMIY